MLQIGNSLNQGNLRITDKTWKNRSRNLYDVATIYLSENQKLPICCCRGKEMSASLSYSLGCFFLLIFYCWCGGKRGICVIENWVRFLKLSVFGTAHQTLWELQTPSTSENAAPGCILWGMCSILSIKVQVLVL